MEKKLCANCGKDAVMHRSELDPKYYCHTCYHECLQWLGEMHGKVRQFESIYKGNHPGLTAFCAGYTDFCDR